MSASQLIVDVESLQEVAKSIKEYIAASQSDLENALRGLQAAEGCWSDEDMRQLQESLQQLTVDVELVGNKGIALAERCNKKVLALEELYSINI